ncbi:MAG TPA: CHAP domain-containing protein [Stellaceae bacterium]|nr:CHAP domain-containing protein [Stellaceae bacterium]
MRLWRVTVTASVVAMGVFFGPVQAQALQCAIFARSETGVHLYGDAWRWWEQAAHDYPRGQRPKLGALLVFKRANGMQHGHVAVVSAVLGPREIAIDHANWSRGRVARRISVVDASPDNDWTIVRVKTEGTTTYGRGNPSYGFIYPDHGAAGVQHALRSLKADSEPDDWQPAEVPQASSESSAGEILTASAPIADAPIWDAPIKEATEQAAPSPDRMAASGTVSSPSVATAPVATQTAPALDLPSPKPVDESISAYSSGQK